ncbi:flagellar export protein FliJ [Mucisphaera calidilacus]|uniref:Flagellar FliJ protein n=1 Tax=Mucisphaera calidilacus TaxID=2527982 RepID=A0A518BYY6_9BACT|nr:flagellar export protein FliJ [Mucisphaera calidilacus]QDU72183.1 Flagellar FliJ protein [Mucisphaera calidilacus]
MPRFRFRFQKLLEERRRAEQQAQRELAELLGRRDQLHARLVDTQQRISQSKTGLRDALVGTLDLPAVTQFGRHSNHMLAAGQGIVRQIAAAEPHINAARLRLNHAIQRRKALELLHDRELTEWKRNLNRRETNALDEAANQMTLSRRATA